MTKIWSYITAWFEKQGGFSHVIAGAWVTITLAYAAVPEFKDAVVGAFDASPSWLHKLIAIAVPLYVWYANTHKKATQ